jgi:hypothetical protein
MSSDIYHNYDSVLSHLQRHEQGESIGLEHLSNVNVETLSRLQREDPTLSNCRLKALNNVDGSKGVKFAFYYENNVLKRKWEEQIFIYYNEIEINVRENRRDNHE